ncbi:hypothetical protein [Haloferula sp. A504]|uniref:hypothetical protein n=1 Tax=Haloferula sp. A504 TaxID=3373601 RepID=UPI0031CB99A1|nr:hypothetical protein [Verrucomicrobiaceae bacterium E54]
MKLLPSCGKNRVDARLSLFELVDLCRTCHHLAPFTNFNGKTLAAIARGLIDRLDLRADREAVVRSLVGHIVAGVAPDQEDQAFESFCNDFQ